MIDTTTVNGHYMVYCRGGVYYVNASYVKLRLVNAAKPSISYTVVFNGDILYVVDDGSAPGGITYYPESGYSKQTTASKQKIYVDLNDYEILPK